MDKIDLVKKWLPTGLLDFTSDKEKLAYTLERVSEKLLHDNSVDIEASIILWAFAKIGSKNEVSLNDYDKIKELCFIFNKELKTPDVEEGILDELENGSLVKWRNDY